MAQTQNDGGGPRARSYTTLMAGCFLLLGVINLLGRDWPKAARYLVTLAVAALASAVLVRLIPRPKAAG